jgi:hypothetical protein
MLETAEACTYCLIVGRPLDLSLVRIIWAVGYLMRGRFETVERWSCYLMLWGMLQGVSLPRPRHLLHFLTCLRKLQK